MPAVIQNSPTQVTPIQTGKIHSQEVEVSKKIGETFHSALSRPVNEYLLPPKSDSSYALLDRAIARGDSSSFSLLKEFQEEEEKTKKLAEEMIQASKLNISLPLILINLYTRYYDSVYVPRVSSLIGKAKQKEEEIKDLNLLIGALDKATANKKGVFDLSEHTSLIEKVRSQEGACLLSDTSTWSSPEQVKNQIASLRSSIQNKTQEVSTLLTEVAQEKESVHQLFDPVKLSIEEHQKAMDRMAQRMNSR